MESKGNLTSILHLRSFIDACPVEDFLDHINLSFLVAFLWATLGIVTVVHVFAPHLLPQARRLVIKSGNALVQFVLGYAHADFMTQVFRMSDIVTIMTTGFETDMEF